MFSPSAVSLMNHHDHDRNSSTIGISYGTISTTSEDDDLEVHTDFDDAASIVTSVVDNLKEFAFSGEHVGVQEFEGDVPMTNQIFNLIKNLVGCGVLALPSGIGAFAGSTSAIIPAAIINVIMACIFGYYFLLIGKICKMVGAVSYREAWLETMGEKGSFVVATVNMLKPGLCNVAYSMILADSFKALLEGFHCPLSRTTVLLLITVFALLPLCLLKNLKALAPFSVLGSLGIVLTAAAMGVRFFDGTYDPSRDGRFLQDIPGHLQPKFNHVGANGVFSPHVMVYVCMLFEAYVAHYNAPRFYIELERRTVKRFRRVISYSFGSSVGLYIVMASFGFLTFGVNCDGYVLNNYSDYDNLANMCRCAIAFAIVFTYPIVFMGFRDGVFDLLPISTAQETAHLSNLMTVVLLVLVTVLAALFDNLGMLNAIGGGTIATAVVFIFPTMMYRGALLHNNLSLDGAKPDELREVRLVTILMMFGIVMGLVGVWMGIADLQRK